MFSSYLPTAPKRSWLEILAEVSILIPLTPTFRSCPTDRPPPLDSTKFWKLRLPFGHLPSQCFDGLSTLPFNSLRFFPPEARSRRGFAGRQGGFWAIEVEGHLFSPAESIISPKNFLQRRCHVELLAVRGQSEVREDRARFLDGTTEISGDGSPVEGGRFRGEGGRNWLLVA